MSSVAQPGVDLDEVLAAAQLRSGVGLLVVLQHAGRRRGAPRPRRPSDGEQRACGTREHVEHHPPARGELLHRVVESRAGSPDRTVVSGTVAFRGKPVRSAAEHGDHGSGERVDGHAATAEASAASLAATVLDEEDTREEAQKRSREQVIFPDDLLPGVNSEPVSFKEAFKVGGKLMFVVLLLLYSFDELEGAAINVLAPEIRRTFHISSGTIVFIATASAAFFVLGAVPMGWLADRVKRVPIVGWASLAFGVLRVRCPGLAVSAFMLFWTRFATGIAKANSIPVHQSLIADNYPIGIRARMSATINMGGHGIGLVSPVLVRRHRHVGRRASRAGAGRGSCSASRWSSSRSLAFFMKEPPRGQFEKQDVLGEVIEDEQPAPDLDGSRLRPHQAHPHDPHRARRVLRAGLRPLQPARARVAVPRRQPAREGRARARASSSASRASSPCRSCRSSGATSTASTARTRPRRWRWSAC